MPNKHTKSRARKSFRRKLDKVYIAFLKLNWFDQRRGLHNYLNDLVQRYRTTEQGCRQRQQAKDYGWGSRY